MASIKNIPREFTGATVWHSHGVRGEGVYVAVIDSGVHRHEDLTVLDGYAVEPNEVATVDVNPFGHGTHVAGIAAGAVYGVAPGAVILPVKITKGDGNWSSVNHIKKALEWILAWHKANPAKRVVVNISFAGTSSRDLVDVINELAAEGIPVVVGACNSGQEQSPLAEYDTPIVVANAQNETEMNDTSTCWGDLTDCCVIGTNVISCDNADTGYVVMSGTSMAAPAVAGMLALILSRWPDMTEQEAYDYLMQHATPAEVQCPSGKHLIPRVELPDDFDDSDGGSDNEDGGGNNENSGGEDSTVRETKVIFGVTDGKALIVRESADTASDKVGYLYNGDKVTVLERQGDRALVATGTCGWINADYLTDQAAKPPEETDPNPPSDWPETVEGLQQALADWGFGAIVGEIDGKVGPKTKEATKQFQSAMGLTADGIAGPKTWAALKSGIIVPRLTEVDMMCQCPDYCDGYPNASTIGVRLLVERIWRKAEEKYPGLKIYVTNRAEPTPDGAIAGGQRCEHWNAERGGANGSQHKFGRAADIYGKLDGVADAEIRQHLEDIALEMNVSGGVGYGAKYIVHVDVRGTKARWRY